jgi:CubicO group peptidase (beta-lactamase class C family)
MPWQQLVQQKIVAPMGLRQTTAWNKQLTDMAIGYNDKGAATPYWDFSALAAAGSIRSNAQDLLEYGIKTMALMKQPKGAGPLLIKPTYHQDQTTVTLGWHCNHNGTGKGPMIFSHDGGTYGFRTHLSVCPAKQWVAVVLTNLATDPGASEVGAKIDAWLSK